MVEVHYEHDTRRVRPQRMENNQTTSTGGWLAQIEAQAKAIPQPPGCLPVAVGMALDQLLTKLRLAADLEVFESFDKSEASLRKLKDASLYEITEHVYANLDTLVEQLKWRWREENAAFAERANAWRWRRQGWFLLLGESEEGSVLVSPDRERTFLVRGLEMSLSAKLRAKLPEAELPAAVWLTLLPWEGYITYDGLLACRALPAAQRAALQRDLQPQYEAAIGALEQPAQPRAARGAVQGAATEQAHLESEALPEWATRAFGSCGGAVAAGDGKDGWVEAQEAEAEEAPPLERRLRPGLARYDPQEQWPAEASAAAPLPPVMPLLAKAAKAEAAKAFQKADYARAKRLYSVALSSFPDKAEHPALLGNRSLCHLRLNESAAALSDALAATIAAPQWAKGWGRKAAALQAQRDYAGAMAAVETALELAPGDKAFEAMRAEMVALLAAAPAEAAPPKAEATLGSEQKPAGKTGGRAGAAGKAEGTGEGASEAGWRRATITGPDGTPIEIEGTPAFIEATMRKAQAPTAEQVAAADAAAAALIAEEEEEKQKAAAKGKKKK